MSFRTQLLMLFAMLAMTQQALAHYCAPPYPCKKYWEAHAVFTGTVTKTVIQRTREDYTLLTVVVRVEEAFRGDMKAGQDVELIDNSEYQSPEHLELGKKYFFYAIGSYTEPGRYAGIRLCSSDSPCVEDKPRTLYAGLAICSATKPLKDAADDLEYARNVQKNQGGMIFGRVQVGGTGNYLSVNSLARDALARNQYEGGNGRVVKATSQDGTVYQAVTDQAGWFSIKQLPASTYKLELDASEKFHPVKPYQVEIKQNRCENLYWPIFPAHLAQIRGKLLDDQGQPKANDMVYLVPSDQAVKATEKDYSSFDRSYTNSDGEYHFPETTPGRYVIVAHPHGPEETDPFRKAYYGGGAEVSTAKIIEAAVGQRLSLDDFKLVEKEPILWIQGKAVLSDGKPAKGAHIASYRQGDPYWNARAVEVKADDQGLFSLPCLEGREYSVTASHDPNENHAAEEAEKPLVCGTGTRFDLELKKTTQ